MTPLRHVTNRKGPPSGKRGGAALLDEATPPSANRRKPLLVSFAGELSECIRNEAHRRRVVPNVLVGALLKLIIDNGMIDAVLDGERPEDIAPGHGGHISGLTRHQRGMIFILALHADCDGVTSLGRKQLANLLSLQKSSSAESVLKALEKNGLIRKSAELGSGGIRPIALTEAGWIIARTLGDIHRGVGGRV